MSSSFYGYWHVQQVQQQAELQRQIEQARPAWVGRRVWFRFVPAGDLKYGEIVEITDQGHAKIVYGYDQLDRPLCVGVPLHLLGAGVTLAE